MILMSPVLIESRENPKTKMSIGYIETWYKKSENGEFALDRRQSSQKLRYHYGPKLRNMFSLPETWFAVK